MTSTKPLSKNKDQFTLKNGQLTLQQFKAAYYEHLENDDFLYKLNEVGLFDGERHPTRLALRSGILSLKKTNMPCNPENLMFMVDDKTIVVSEGAWIDRIELLREQLEFLEIRCDNLRYQRILQLVSCSDVYEDF